MEQLQADPLPDKKPLRRGRPRKPASKILVTLHLNPEVLEFFKNTGAGWQTRMNDTLEAFVAGARAAHANPPAKIDVKRRPSKEAKEVLAMIEQMKELLHMGIEKHEDKKRA